MKRSRVLSLLALAALSAALLAACAPSATTAPAAPLPDPTTYRPADTAVSVPGLGEVGRWMITKDLVPATWLGEKLGGRTLREPVNVLLIDRAARTPQEAAARLLTAMTAAGYVPRGGHSNGYWGEVGGRPSPMLPAGPGEAFSTRPFWCPTTTDGCSAPSRCRPASPSPGHSAARACACCPGPATLSAPSRWPARTWPTSSAPIPPSSGPGTWTWGQR